jgi:hypothetical protein
MNLRLHLLFQLAVDLRPQVAKETNFLFEGRVFRLHLRGVNFDFFDFAEFLGVHALLLSQAGV